MSEDAEERDYVKIIGRREKTRYTDEYQGKLLKTYTPIQGVHDVLHAL